MNFDAGKVSVEILEGKSKFTGVPTSQWHGDRQEQTGEAVVANLKTPDGLRAQVVFVVWPDGAESSLRIADFLAGPADYERLKDAGEMSPKSLGDKFVARIRALRYGDNGRATIAGVDWEQIDEWYGGDVRQELGELGARTGTYSELYPEATRFKTEPAIEVPKNKPEALFLVYALTRVMPIMTGYGKPTAQAAN